MKAVVFTLGCKVNDCESASLMAGLESLGYEVSNELSPAELYILNTCAVTKEAEAKSRQAIARARKYNQNARIIVCGCAAEKNASSFLNRDGVELVTGARRKDRILELLSSSGCMVESDDGSFEELPFPKQTKTRAYVKIQDGCNRFCSYCVIPYLRGRSRSRSVASCKAEIMASGAEEIVLTGIDISSYRDGEHTLTDLLTSLSGIEARIRLGSLEASAIDEGLLSACRNLKNFAPQFHLSLQSGSNAVLKKMNRHYTREDYLSKCRLIYEYFPDGAITTDIIAGFPTETEEDFSESLSIVREAGFSQVHCFAFSPREGTAAARLPDLSPAVKKERLHRLLRCAAEQKEDYLTRFLGKEVEFLPEEESDGYTVGFTGNYMRVYTKSDKRKVTLVGLYRDGVLGE